jgi:hypothetical protein
VGVLIASGLQGCCLWVKLSRADQPQAGSRSLVDLACFTAEVSLTGIRQAGRQFPCTQCKGVPLTILHCPLMLITAEVLSAAVGGCVCLSASLALAPPSCHIPSDMNRTYCKHTGGRQQKQRFSQKCVYLMVYQLPETSTVTVSFCVVQLLGSITAEPLVAWSSGFAHPCLRSSPLPGHDGLDLQLRRWGGGGMYAGDESGSRTARGLCKQGPRGMICLMCEGERCVTYLICPCSRSHRKQHDA